MDIANKVLVGVQSMLSLRKRPADSDEGRLDGQRFAKRRRILNPSTNTSGAKYRPASSSNTSSMPPPLAKELLSSDDEIKDSPTDNPPARANPLQNIPESDDDIEEISDGSTRIETPLTDQLSQRLTRSAHNASSSPQLSAAELADLFPEKHSRNIGRRRAPEQDEDKGLTAIKPKMKKPFTQRAYHLNTLDNRAAPTSTRQQYAAREQRRTHFDTTRAPPASIATGPGQVNGNTTTTRPVSRNGPSDPNPPYKKPRIGPSPMQGRSQHDAISLDDSTDHIEVHNEIQCSPPLPARAIDYVARSDMRKQQAAQNDILSRNRASEDEVVMLPNKSPTQRTTRRRDDRDVRRPGVQHVDSDDDDGFTKHAAAQRRAQDQESNEFGSSLNSMIQSDHFTSANSAIRSSNRQIRGASKSNLQREGSQSPDVLQQGTTTNKAAAAYDQKSIRSRQKLSQISASSLGSLIVGNAASTKITHRIPVKKQVADAQLARFDLKDVCWYCFEYLPENCLDRLCFVVDVSRGKFYFDLKAPLIGASSDDPTEALSSKHPISRITRVRYGHKVGILIVDLSHSEHDPDGPIALDLGSLKPAVDLINALTEYDAGLRMSEEQDEKLEQIRQKLASKRSKYSVFVQQTRDAERATVSSLPASTSNRNESTQQQLHLGVRPDRAPPTIITGSERQMDSRQSSGDSAEYEPSQSRQATRRSGMGQELKSEYFSDPKIRGHNLRSTSATKRREETLKPSKIKFSKTGALGPEWKQPLVYPKDGKKRESVSFDDLWRLDDDEFLNDNLISFFSRYIQHRTELEQPEIMKKVHFFNSYFFESLNKGIKGVKNINYEAVARWTNKVNLFSRDFVIVPVNESLHWYIAIICNLPYFKKTDEEREIEAETEDNEDVPEDKHTNETQKSFEELTIDDRASSHTRTPTKRGRGRKTKRVSLQKYDTSMPIIITLDSLGSARSATCSALKKYIVREAKDKLDLDISDQDIKGMTAKNIPTQGNWSDCGLYLCMYLEQFICDPHRFVEKLLRREEGKIRWPREIESDDLRARMRDLILDLHRKQEGDAETNLLPQLGKILVNMRESSPEAEIIPDSPQQTMSELAKESKRRVSEDSSQQEHFSSLQIQQPETVSLTETNDAGFQAHEDFIDITESSQARLNNEALAKVDAPYVVLDEESTPIRKKRKVETIENKSSSGPWHHNDPRDLARQMRETRSPHPQRVTEKPTEHSANSRRQRRSIKVPSSPTRKRSASVSTDFMLDNEGFVDAETVVAAQSAEMEGRRVRGGRRATPFPRENSARRVLGDISVQYGVPVQQNMPAQGSDSDNDERHYQRAEENLGGAPVDGDDDVDDCEDIEVQELAAEVPETQSQSQRQLLDQTQPALVDYTTASESDGDNGAGEEVMLLQ